MANITLKLNVVSTERVTDPSGSGLQSWRNTITDFTLDTTTSAYGTDVPALGNKVYSHILTKVSGTVEEIQAQVVIANVDATEYSTPRTYYNQPDADGNEAHPNLPTSENRTSFIVGPSDYSDGTTLGVKLLAGVTSAVNTIQ